MEPRQRLAQKKAEFQVRPPTSRPTSGRCWRSARRSPRRFAAFRRDLNAGDGARRAAPVRDCATEYRRTLDKHGVLDFSDVLERTVALLEQRDEFSRSRFKLESRYRHVLVDEFQDTSRAQWRLVRELMSAWAEGAGAADDRRPALDLHRRRPQAVDLRLSRRRSGGARGGGAAHRRAPPGPAGARGDHAQPSSGAAAAALRQRRVRRRGEAAARGPTRSATRTMTGFRWPPAAGRAPDDDGPGRGAERRRAGRDGGRRDRPAAGGRGRRCAIA